MSAKTKAARLRTRGSWESLLRHLINVVCDTRGQHSERSRVRKLAGRPANRYRVCCKVADNHQQTSGMTTSKRVEVEVAGFGISSVWLPGLPKRPLAAGELKPVP